jgi:hypothetical protein
VERGGALYPYTDSNEYSHMGEWWGSNLTEFIAESITEIEMA